MLLAACSNNKQAATEASINTAHTDEFVYVPEIVDIDYMEGAYIHASVMHDDLFYIYYSGHDKSGRYSDYVAGISSAGEIIKSVEIRSRGLTQIAGIQITDEDNIAILAMERDIFSNDVSSKICYTEYDFKGNEILRHDFTNQLPQSDNVLPTMRAVFTNDGNIVLSYQHYLDSTIYLLSLDNNTISILDHNLNPRGNCVVRLQDDRVLVLDTESDEVVLREIDFKGKKWGETYPVIENHMIGMYPVSGDSGFDFLIYDNNNLYGHNLNTGEFTVLLNWMETEILNIEDALIGLYNDSNIFSITGLRYAAQEMIILRPVPRDGLPGGALQKTVLRLGGLRIPDKIRSAVIAFNRESKDYRIELIDYLGAEGDWAGGLTRFQVELVTGRGPDIIYDWGREIRSPVYMLDLYPFIDADPELAREDFFASLLRSVEHSNGCLYRISDEFSISTMIGPKTALGHIDNWTTNELLAFIEASTDDASQPLGAIMAGRVFATMRMQDREFIDFDNYKSYLNSEGFINVLKAAALLPKDQDLERAMIHQFILLRSGEQLLAEWGFDNFYQFQGFSDLLGDEFLILGNPTASGGINTAYGNILLGINAASDHPDGAWEFIRRFMLPVDLPPAESVEHYKFYSFPLRIDTYEALVAHAQTPQYIRNHDGSLFLDADGNQVENPRWSFLLWGGLDGINYSHDLFTMTDDTAKKMREFVDSAQPIGGRFNMELFNLISGDIDAFFDGFRTAEDTARILQSRVQTYLSEQELLG